MPRAFLARILLTMGLTACSDRAAHDGSTTPRAAGSAHHDEQTSRGKGKRGTLAKAPAAAASAVPEPTALAVRVVATYPHDRSAFTQGLLVHEGKLIESTGQRGESSLRIVELVTGRVERKVDLEAELFAEGLALVGDRLIQLTWTEGRALVWNVGSLQRVREFSYRGEGWGLCFDGRRLIMSDGSQRLTFRDPATFEVTGGVDVVAPGGPVRRLNELECVDGLVYANVWTRDRIVRIDPSTGHVTGVIDLRGLLSQDERDGTEDVLNGIAHRPDNGHLLVTGKYWPKLFELEIVDPTEARAPGVSPGSARAGVEAR